MRLFPKADGVIDRFERGGLLTMPFDLDFGEPIIIDIPDHIFFTSETILKPSVTSETMLKPSVTSESISHSAN